MKYLAVFVVCLWALSCSSTAEEILLAFPTTAHVMSVLVCISCIWTIAHLVTSAEIFEVPRSLLKNNYYLYTLFTCFECFSFWVSLAACFYFRENFFLCYCLVNVLDTILSKLRS